MTQETKWSFDQYLNSLSNAMKKKDNDELDMVSCPSCFSPYIDERDASTCPCLEEVR